MPHLAMATTLASTIAVIVALHLGRLALRWRAAFHAVSASALRQQWIAWWQLNALESTPADPSRELYLRLALVAQLAPTLEAFRAELVRLELDMSAPHALRVAAGAYLGELDAPRPPWTIWDETTGRPRHNPEALKRAMSALLHSQVHSLEDRSANPRRAESNSI